MNALPLREMHLFAGAGGGILGGLLLGHVPVCAVELEDYPRQVLLQRQRDGILPWFPIWDDVRTFDGHPWRGHVDVICGGFPCQDISSAGRGAGIDGERSGLWSEFARIIGEVRPRFVFVENSPLLTSRGLGRVLGDLATLGFDAEWGVLGAEDTGAPHKRDRIWIMAYTDKIGREKMRRPKARKPWETGDGPWGSLESSGTRCGRTRRIPDPRVCCVATRVAYGVDEIGVLGNGQVPAVAALAWKTLQERRVS